MSAATNLKRRGAVYYCRRRIPLELTGHYGGKQELCVSLHTKDLREARKRANEQWMHWEAELEALRRVNGVPLPVRELTDEQIQALADWYHAGMLKWDEWARVQGLSEGDYEEISATVVDSFLPAALARGDTVRAGFLTHITLKLHGITVPKNSPSYRKLTYALLKAAVRTNEAVGMRQQGKVVDTPPDPPAILATPRKGNGVKLAGVLDKWAAERSPRSKT